MTGGNSDASLISVSEVTRQPANHRGQEICFGIAAIVFASAKAEDNKVARTTVALVMLELALELDPDLFSARRWQ